jgi:Rrf2 family iron-sulfur cluster assembly transcriptional regulator
MRLSTKGRYAVMAMADLAGHEGGGRPVSLADIAERQEISLSILSSSLPSFVVEGWLRASEAPAAAIV